MPTPGDITALRRRLEGALAILATLVVEDTAYLPLFQRLEDELARLDRDQTAVERARALAARGSHKAIR